MEGEPWVDRVMAPLSSQLTSERYNRIYGAVYARSEQHGTRLVAAIDGALEAARREAETKGFELLWRCLDDASQQRFVDFVLSEKAKRSAPEAPND